MRPLIVLTLLLAAGAGAASLTEQGRALYAANQLNEARSVLRRAVRSNPLDARARFWLAFTDLGLDDLNGALRNFEALENTYAADAEYLYAISETYTRSARKLANDLVALGDVARAHQHLAWRYSLTGDWQTAVDELRIASAERPKLAGLHLDAAQLLWEQKRYEEAARELQAELAVAPLDFLANLRYGQYLLRVNRPADAAATLEIAARYRKMPEADQMLAFCWEQSGRPERALAVLNGAAAAFPDSSDVAQMRHELLARNPQLREDSLSVAAPPLTEPRPRIPDLRAALDRNPKDEDALFLLSQAYSERGADFFERLQKAAPDSVRVLQIKGSNAEATGDLAEAEACYRTVIARDARLGGAHYALGHLLHRLGRDDEALAEFQREIDIDPRHYLAYFELGATRLQKGDAEAALPLLEKSIRLRPGFRDAKVDLAKAYLQLKRPAQAIPLLNGVIASMPDHPTAHYLLSRAYIATGAVEEGRREIAVHQEITRKQSRLRRGMAQQQREQGSR